MSVTSTTHQRLQPTCSARNFVQRWFSAAKADYQLAVIQWIYLFSGVSVTAATKRGEITRSVDLSVEQVGTYQIEVVGIGSTGKRSQAATLTFTAVGKTAPPTSIAGLNISPVDAHAAELYWPQSTDLDVRVGERTN